MAGLVQSGGFGSFSKRFGLVHADIRAGLDEAMHAAGARVVLIGRREAASEFHEVILSEYESSLQAFRLLLGPVPEGYSGSMTDYTALKDAGALMIGWGQFVTVLINFLILAFIIFLLVRWANRVRSRAEEGPASDPAELVLLREIRDELRKQGEATSKLFLP